MAPPSSLLSIFDAVRRASLVGRAPGLAAPPRVDVAAHLVERLARVLRAQGRRRFEGTGLADGPVWKSKFYGALVLNHRVDLHAIDATPARWRGDVGS